MNESRNPKSNGWHMMLKLLCFKDVKSLVSCFMFLALFCCFTNHCVVVFQWNGFCELGSMMEPNPCCSFDNILRSVSHDYWK
jgi:hypothetical protein